MTVTAELPATDSRQPTLSWEAMPAEQPSTATVQRVIRACDTVTLGIGFRDSDGSALASRRVDVESQTYDSRAGKIEVTGPADVTVNCQDVSVSGSGSCAEPRGWLLAFLDPQQGTFQLTSPVDFGAGVPPSTITVTGTLAPA